MKYLVMECNPGYAVLMDEESRVVRAANLHYSVGMTVTDPILMKDQTEKPQISKTIIMRFAAAAACLLILSTAGIALYLRNRRASESVVMLVEQKRYEMSLNRSGEVIHIQEENDEGKTVVENYEGQHISLASALNTVLQDSLDQGSISEETPVQIYLSAENEKAYDEYKAEIEQEAAKLQLKAEVQALEPPKDAVKPPEPPKEPPKEINPPEPGNHPEPGKEEAGPAIEPPAPGKIDDAPGVKPPEHEQDPIPPEDKADIPSDDKPVPPEHGPEEPPAGPDEPAKPPKAPQVPRPLPELLKPEAEPPVLIPETPETDADHLLPEPTDILQNDAFLPDEPAMEPVTIVPPTPDT